MAQTDPAEAIRKRWGITDRRARRGKKPTDRWLTLASAAVGIALYLLPKHPVIVVLGCIAIFACLIHPVWNAWWIEDHMVRRVSAVTILVLVCGIVGYASWPKAQIPTKPPAPKPPQTATTSPPIINSPTSSPPVSAEELAEELAKRLQKPSSESTGLGNLRERLLEMANTLRVFLDRQEQRRHEKVAVLGNAQTTDEINKIDMEMAKSTSGVFEHQYRDDVIRLRDEAASLHFINTELDETLRYMVQLEQQIASDRNGKLKNFTPVNGGMVNAMRDGLENLAASVK